MLAHFDLPELNRHYLMPEAELLAQLLAGAELPAEQQQNSRALAEKLITAVRANKEENKISQLLATYSLNSAEGIALMCVAEALLRIPDSATADALIRDKIGSTGWNKQVDGDGQTFSRFTNWAMALTGNVVKLDGGDSGWGIFGKIVNKMGEPIIRETLKQGMKLLGGQFVLGETIQDALKNSRSWHAQGYTFSYDMLGEAARTHEDAERYFDAYRGAIFATGAQNDRQLPIEQVAGVSIKLSALHPRYEWRNMTRIRAELLPQLKALIVQAREHHVGITIDAEEADRLLPSLELFSALALDPALKDWQGLGLAVQAYSKRMLPVLQGLQRLVQARGCRLPVRLVKGAYWDSEIKIAQQEGQSGYPVFTRKQATDVSFLVGAKFLLSDPVSFYPMLASHNALTISSILNISSGDFELQRLHGMGEKLYAQLAAQGVMPRCRIYAPVGPHKDLLAYLVRRLLENGANSSFVHQIADKNISIDTLLQDPVEVMKAVEPKAHPRIPLPRDLYGGERINSPGILLAEPLTRDALGKQIEKLLALPLQAAPMVAGQMQSGPAKAVFDPSDRRRQIGSVVEATADQAERAIAFAQRAQASWNARGGDARATILERAGDLFETYQAELLALVVREGGRTLPNALSEWREAVDFCRYYAAQVRRDFTNAVTLPGPTGESNQLSLHGRGIFACISPWNFPLAIFTGQVVAALAAGNAVLAKPAAQTPLVAFRVVQLLHEAGVPVDILHFLPGPGRVLGDVIAKDPRVSGVAFTGSTAVGQTLAQNLASRLPLATLIAETGGQNVMIVDSSALPEQVVADVLTSAFDSAGQRCSALRLLYLQEEIADRVLELLQGALREWRVGDPLDFATDSGPVIDAAAKQKLMQHVQNLPLGTRVIMQHALAAEHESGHFMAPYIIEIPGIHVLKEEVFGPILHIARYKRSQLDQVIAAINGTGYGLTFGIHSRIDETVDYISSRIRAGNIYVNRNMIGAVVGVQPFGGEGLSGTGPKAGGPHYLHRFALERTLTINTAATGGNASLLSVEAD